MRVDIAQIVKAVAFCFMVLFTTGCASEPTNLVMGKQEKSLAGIKISDITITGEHQEDIRTMLLLKLPDAGVEFTREPDLDLKGKVELIPWRYHEVRLVIESSGKFSTSYDLPYFTLSGSVFLGNDGRIGGRLVSLLADQIVNDFIRQVKNRDLLYRKYN